jgi:hypothetical protein
MAPARFDQAAETDRLVVTLERHLHQDYSPPRVKRDAHPKMHGCVQGEFRVDDAVPADLARGVFAHRGETFRAWVRFSNAFGLQHDIEFETRGLAIKVLGVAGDRLEGVDLVGDDEEGTQDFLMATHDRFFLPNVDEYAEFADAAAAGPMQIGQFFLWRPRLWRGFRGLLRSAFVLARNPLAIRYFSQTAYQLGPDRVVKLQARPCRTPALAAALPSWWAFRVKALGGNAALFLRELHGTKEQAEEFCDRYFARRDLLRHAMMSFLPHHDASFEILVQRQTDPLDMPIEDPTKKWTSSFHKVATLRIPPQVFWPEPGMPPLVASATADMVDLGENMSFNPWHALKDHKPLGGINLARRTVYPAIASLRRSANGVARPAPTAEYDRLLPIIRR